MSEEEAQVLNDDEDKEVDHEMMDDLMDGLTSASDD